MDAHGLLQAFLVDGHLNGHMRQVRVDLFIGQRLHRGVVGRVLMELGNWTDTIKKMNQRASVRNTRTQLTNTRGWRLPGGRRTD